MSRRRSRRSPAPDAGAEGFPAEEKIARLLALMVVRDMETEDAALKLDDVGFDAHEISLLLGVGSNYLNVAKHRKKKGGAKKKAKKAS